MIIYRLKSKEKGGIITVKLFWRRPLSLACFLFLLLSFLSSYIPLAAKPVIIVALVLIIIFTASAFLLSRKEKVGNRIFISLMCIVFAFLAIVNNYLRIDIPQSHAESREGITVAEIFVLSKETSSEYRSEYIVKIKRIGGEKTNVKALLVCGGKGTAEPFDTIYASVDIRASADSTTLYYGSDLLLTAYLDEGTKAVVSTDGRGVTLEKIFSNGFDGIIIGLNFLRNAVSEYIVDLFGAESGGLAAGLLMNDTSNISPEVTRDFRRSGVSHLLAVSGLHISLLIGAAELLLKKLRIPKSARYPILALSALLMLTLAGFSMSACRSVFMLFILYLCYMFFEGNDSPTSLFFSVALIVLISPYAIYDLGLFMSFAATLGLVTVYPIFESFSRKIFERKEGKSVALRVARGVTNIVAITIIANIFILPANWIYFGEISIASLPVNLLASPIISLLLPLIAIGALFGKVIFIGKIIVCLVGALSGILINITESFSRLPMATVSLKYDFAAPIIFIFIVVMIVFLVIDIKKKWILSLPAAVAVIVFSISLSVFNLTDRSELTYYSYRNKDLFLGVNNGGAVVIDLSHNNSGSYDAIVELAKENTAVYLKRIVIASPDRTLLPSLERVMKNNILEGILLPAPQNNSEKEVVNEIYRLAESYGVFVELYESREIIELLPNLSFSITEGGNAYFTDGKEVVFYTNEDRLTATDAADMSDIIIIGSQGKSEKRIELSENIDSRLILSSADISLRSENDLPREIYLISSPYYIELFGVFD